MKKFNTLLFTLAGISVLTACTTAQNNPATPQNTPVEEPDVNQTSTNDVPELTIPADVTPDDNSDENTSVSVGNNAFTEYSNFISDYNSYEWEQTYYEVDYGWNAFQLIDFDDDDTPELIATNTDSETRFDAGMQCYLILDYVDNELVINELADGVASAGGYRGTKYYNPGEGLIYDYVTTAPWGVPAFSVYESGSDGVIRLINAGYFDPDEDYDGDYSKGKWYWDAQEITEKEFLDLEDSYSNHDTGIALSEIQYVDKETMIKNLSELASNADTDTKLDKNHIINVLSDKYGCVPPFYCTFDSTDEDGNYVFHIFEEVDNEDESHTATVDWVTVNPYTGEATTFLDEKFNINE